MSKDSFLFAYIFGLTSGIAISAAATYFLTVSKTLANNSRRSEPPRSRNSFDYSSQQSISKENAISKLEREFTISSKKLHEIVKHFVKEMHRGLMSDNQTLRMIPSYVSQMPTGNEVGTILALDLGGSNFRVCEVYLEGKGQVRMLQKKYVVSDQLKTGKGQALFDFFASSIREFYEENGIDMTSFKKLGFTFSFPCRQTAIDKGNQAFM